jgi:hypothetical protein
MSVETITPTVKAKTEEAPERRVLVRRVSWPSWLLRVFVESFFIMFSILMALAVDNWRENRQNRRLAQQTLRIFEREIRLNLATIEDITPYHSGLRSVVAEAIANPAQAADMRTIVEGLRPTILQNTAWQTAGASGGLTHIDVETTWQLSLTYSFQERFRQQTLASLPSFSLAAVADKEEMQRNVRQMHNYLNELVTLEQDLRAAYLQAIEIIRTGIRETIPASTVDTSSP